MIGFWIKWSNPVRWLVFLNAMIQPSDMYLFLNSMIQASEMYWLFNAIVQPDLPSSPIVVHIGYCAGQQVGSQLGASFEINFSDWQVSSSEENLLRCCGYRRGNQDGPRYQHNSYNIHHSHLVASPRVRNWIQDFAIRVRFKMYFCIISWRRCRPGDLTTDSIIYIIGTLSWDDWLYAQIIRRSKEGSRYSVCVLFKSNSVACIRTAWLECSYDSLLGDPEWEMQLVSVNRKSHFKWR